MKFLEAAKIAKRAPGGTPVPLFVGLSGLLGPLELFLQAHASQRGWSLDLRVLPFNTLHQHLASAPAPAENEVYLLLPWDFVPEWDWRSGLPERPLDRAQCLKQAHNMASQLARRPGASFMYIAAPVPPLTSNPAEMRDLAQAVNCIASQLGARMLESDVFALGNYLGSGCPISGQHQSKVAEIVVESVLKPSRESCKVLVTDLDNVLWSGVVAEDGATGVACGPEGAGYRHYLFQTYLRRLQRDGLLLAAVSRNDADVARAPFKSGRMVLKEEDFVAILASYGSKSAQIRQLSERLNLGLRDFLFVDDNEVELEEVNRALPEVKVLQFPRSDDGIPALFNDLSRTFFVETVTEEDRQRTALYRQRFEGLTPTDMDGADVSDFLRCLEMTMTIEDRTAEEHFRAQQLINKTNQFNLNGRRLSEEDLKQVLGRGGRLYSAALHDRTGSHGEILSCLISAEGIVEALVLSCRVFQRRVEHAFVCWLAGLSNAPRAFRFARTERNTPFCTFLQEPGFTMGDGALVAFHSAGFKDTHLDDLALFRIQDLTQSR